MTQRTAPFQLQEVLDTIIIITGMIIYLLFSAPPLSGYILFGACFAFLPWIFLNRFSVMAKILLVPLSILITTLVIIVGTIQNPTVIGGFNSAADPGHNASVMMQNLSYIIILPTTIIFAKLSSILSQDTTTSVDSASSKQQSTDLTSTEGETGPNAVNNNNSDDTQIYNESTGDNTKVYERDGK